MAEKQNEEIRQAKRVYAREWRKKNPERAAQIQERVWLKKADEIRSRERLAEPEKESD